MILKFLCLVLGLAMIGASFYQSWEEGLWQKQKLVHLFCAYLEDSYGQRYPITSDLTVIGSSHRLADIVPSIPGARSRQQYRSLSGIPKVCCQEIRLRKRSLLFGECPSENASLPRKRVSISMQTIHSISTKETSCMLHRTHNTREWMLVIAFSVFTLCFMLWVLLESRGTVQYPQWHTVKGHDYYLSV